MEKAKYRVDMGFLQRDSVEREGYAEVRSAGLRKGWNETVQET